MSRPDPVPNYSAEIAPELVRLLLAGLDADVPGDAAVGKDRASAAGEAEARVGGVGFGEVGGTADPADGPRDWAAAPEGRSDPAAPADPAAGGLPGGPDPFDFVSLRRDGGRRFRFRGALVWRDEVEIDAAGASMRRRLGVWVSDAGEAVSELVVEPSPDLPARPIHRVGVIRTDGDFGRFLTENPPEDCFADVSPGRDKDTIRALCAQVRRLPLPVLAGAPIFVHHKDA